ncbi:MAG: cobalamin B12-binding domain-containing protein, partial [Betaproteobacteria bacterium]|nr:cobalamin B12-binding domain-containing protein [Betaproteobacteria bacterium]
MPNAVPSNPAIILCTLNAKYIHASLGLRYLMANMARHGSQALADQTALLEFTLSKPLPDMVLQLLNTLGEERPGQTQVIGFGVYIWNVLQTTELIRLLKSQRPRLKIVLGGPEVSHETDLQEIVKLSDHVITGWGDV